MYIDIVTLFPRMFQGPFQESIIKRAQDKGLVKITIHNLRAWAQDPHKTVDDRPYGGGTGMILMIEPIYYALQDLKQKTKSKKQRVILLSPGGKRFNQRKAQNLAKLDHLILIAGHYEDIDHRVRRHLVDEELSIGDYVLTGGELPAMVVTDVVTRLIPGVLKNETVSSESFSQPMLDFPQYTRPEKFKNWKVPKILLSGNHKKIQEWRIKEALKRTRKHRPDLLR